MNAASLLAMSLMLKVDSLLGIFFKWVYTALLEETTARHIQGDAP